MTKTNGVVRVFERGKPTEIGYGKVGTVTRDMVDNWEVQWVRDEEGGYETVNVDELGCERLGEESYDRVAFLIDSNWRERFSGRRGDDAGRGDVEIGKLGDRQRHISGREKI